MATKAQKGPTFESVLKQVNAGDLKPAYLLMGQENYFIDQLTDAIVAKALREEEQAFNLQVFYGPESDVKTIIGAARSFPMCAERVVVLVKEAQGLRGIEDIAAYMNNPQPSTVLILAYRNGTADARKKYVNMIASQGVVFEAVKVSEVQLPGLIRAFLKEKKCTADEKSVSLIAESVGPDLNRLYGELNKLILSLPAGIPISPELVEKNIGISKDFNYYELQNALVAHNVKKAFQIVRYFEQNPKNYPIQMILPNLYRFFSTLMIAHYAPQKTPAGIANYLGQQEWQVRNNILPAFRFYNATKVLLILGKIKWADGASKGVGGARMSSGNIMKELTAFILG